MKPHAREVFALAMFALVAVADARGCHRRPPPVAPAVEVVHHAAQVAHAAPQARHREGKP